jgi:uncharacterized membrane protein (UPF0127 family)
MTSFRHRSRFDNLARYIGRSCRRLTAMNAVRAFNAAAAVNVFTAMVVATVITAMPLAPARAQSAEPNPPLPHVFLQAGIHRIKAEVADSPAERSRGLMLRKSLQQNSGMLFVFEKTALHCFWMKNTLVPLTIAFLDEDGTIVTLADMQPHDESSHCPERPVRHALEMEQGWFKGKGLKAGDRIGGVVNK